MSFVSIIILYLHLFCVENIDEDIQSSSSIISTSSPITTPLSKRKRAETIRSRASSEDKHNFWTMASTAMESMTKDEEPKDGLKHWILYLEKELRKIKDIKKLKALQRNIIALVDDAGSD